MKRKKPVKRDEFEKWLMQNIAESNALYKLHVAERQSNPDAEIYSSCDHGMLIADLDSLEKYRAFKRQRRKKK